MSAPTIPAFDPKGPDAEILEAFEKVRSHRAYSYSFDYLADSDPAEFERVTDEMAPLDAEQLEHEKMVSGNWATTPSGVAAQITLLISEGGCAREVDRLMAEAGILALYRQRGDLALDGVETGLVVAAYELLHMEWEQALADWERSNRDFTEALKLNSLVEGELIRIRKVGEEPSDFLKNLEALSLGAEATCSDCAALDRLVRTLAPDFAAYQRKAAVALAEDYACVAAPWLVRDVNFLMGGSTPTTKAA